MTKDFTEPQNIALEEIARVDEWELTTLETLVRQKIHEGFSFKYSVMHTLAHAKRPGDVDTATDIKRKELAAKVVALRESMLADFLAHQTEQKARLIK